MDGARVGQGWTTCARLGVVYDGVLHFFTQSFILFYTMTEYLSDSDKKAYAFIRNRIVHGFGTPTLEEINKIINRSSPRSAVLALQRIEKAGLIKRMDRKIRLTSESSSSNTSISVIEIPLVGAVAAGMPILAEENIETTIPVSTGLARPGFRYFLLRVVGTSMNQAKVHGIKIEDGSIVLVRQQGTAENGEIAVALINDEATVKIFEKKNGMVILRPNSSDPYKPIVLTDNCVIQGIVVAVLPSNLY
jgi:repressor LexA